MKNETILKTLKELLELDVDAVQAFDQALESITDTVIRDRLQTFKAQHADHARQIRDEIVKRGGDPSKLPHDFTRHMIEGFITIGSAAGMTGAMKALKLSEEVVNRHYADAVAGDFPEDVREIFREHFLEETIHLDYIINNS